MHRRRLAPYGGWWLVLLPCLFIIAACAHTPHASNSYSGAPELSIKFVTEPVLDTRIRVLTAGLPSLPPVVLIHGLGSQGLNDWHHLIPQLARKYHVVALDLPGFGESDRQNVLYDIENLADVVKWVMDTHNANPHHVIGHSLGAAIALRLAAQYPESIASLVLANVAGVLYRTTVTGYILKLEPNADDTIARIFWPITKTVNMLMETFAGGFGAPLIQNRLHRILHDPDLRQKYLPSGSNILAALGLVLNNFGEDLDKIDKPALIIWSDNDPISPLRTAKLLEYKLKQSVLKIIHNGGHTPMRNQTEIFEHMVLTALQSTVQRTERLIPEPQPSTDSEPAYCLYQDELVTISGEHGRVVIDHCSNVKLTKLTAKEISINESTVDIENTTVVGDEWALLATESNISVRRSYFSGNSFGMLAQESGVQMEQSIIRGGDYGTILADSVADFNAVQTTANDSLLIIDSELHATGSELFGSKSAITTAYEATVMFSVSRVVSEGRDSYLHGPIMIFPDKPL
ncbi:MAG: alpha/beta hydrolase [Gammaproteobacteria bacterium]|nr:alpha/beta hydrolase [Gammaproteobacteria bacterium]